MTEHCSWPVGDCICSVAGPKISREEANKQLLDIGGFAKLSTHTDNGRVILDGEYDFSDLEQILTIMKRYVGNCST